MSLNVLMVCVIYICKVVYQFNFSYQVVTRGSSNFIFWDNFEHIRELL